MFGSRDLVPLESQRRSSDRRGEIARRRGAPSSRRPVRPSARSAPARPPVAKPYVSQYTPTARDAGMIALASALSFTACDVVGGLAARRVQQKLESAMRPLPRGGTPDAHARRATVRRRQQFQADEPGIDHTDRREIRPDALAPLSRAIAPVAPESPANAIAATSSRPSSVVSRRASHAPTISVESPRRNDRELARHVVHGPRVRAARSRSPRADRRASSRWPRCARSASALRRAGRKS